MVICDICKEEGHGNEEDYGRICDVCLKRFQELEKENADLRAENIRLRDNLGPYCGV